MVDSKRKTIIMISSLLLLIIAIILVFTLFSNVNTSKKDYEINSNLYPNLVLIRDYEGTKLHGETTIKSTNNDFKVMGMFNDGVFVSGSIVLKQDGVLYNLEGTFNNFNLQEGKMIITTEDKQIEKTGTFIDNKLDGIGSMLIKDIMTDEIIFYYAGTFESDMPIY